MKKLFTVCFLITIVLSAFAVNHELELFVSPYSWQSVTFYNEDNAKQSSKFGTGFKASYSLKPFENFFVTGIETGFSSYSIKGKSNWFLSWSLLAKAGYTFYMGNYTTVTPSMLYGLEIQHFKDTKCFSQNFGCSLTANFSVSAKWNVSARAEAVFAFPKSDGEFFGNYRVNSYLGAKYSF